MALDEEIKKKVMNSIDACKDALIPAEVLLLARPNRKDTSKKSMLVVAVAGKIAMTIKLNTLLELLISNKILNKSAIKSKIRKESYIC